MLSTCVQIKLYIEKTGLTIQFTFASLLPSTPMKTEESKYTQVFEYLYFKVLSPKDRWHIPKIWLASALTQCPHSHRICLWPKTCLQINNSNVFGIASSYCTKHNLDPKHLQKTPNRSFLQPSYCSVRLPPGERENQARDWEGKTPRVMP